jgi:S-DNA-T family DNA segregation ATPase FtsK/SpoIIIE
MTYQDSIHPQFPNWGFLESCYNVSRMIGKHRSLVRRAFNLRLKRATVFSIAQIIFFALAGLIIVSFSRQGLILVKLNDFLISLFSWTAIFLQFVFLSFGFLISKLKGPLSQPNVVVGILLFFISIISLSRAGILGRSAWDGVSSLVTSAGAFIILLGTAITGLIILFNTSFDQVFEIVSTIIRQIRRFLIGEKGLTPGLGRPQLRVSGVPSTSKKEIRPGQETLAPKLVSNIPGEDKVWKYPPIELLSDTETGKADRGDIKGNAAIIEKTLESFGITARVVEVNLGPAVTQYALEVALGTKLSKITALERDLALALAAPTGSRDRTSQSVPRICSLKKNA